MKRRSCATAVSCVTAEQGRSVYTPKAWVPKSLSPFFPLPLPSTSPPSRPPYDHRTAFWRQLPRALPRSTDALHTGRGLRAVASPAPAVQPHSGSLTQKPSTGTDILEELFKEQIIPINPRRSPKHRRDECSFQCISAPQTLSKELPNLLQHIWVK